MRIREATEADAAPAAALWTEAYTDQNPDEGRTEPYAEGELAVAARARGPGVGRALALRCLELARRQEAAEIVLWSRPYEVEAHSLYESLGFRRTPERDERDPDGRRWVFHARAGVEAVGSAP